MFICMTVSIDCVDREGLHIDITAVRKMYLPLKLRLKSEYFNFTNFSSSLDVYISSDTFLTCFHGLMNKWQRIIFET